jgi:hypothetical protein
MSKLLSSRPKVINVGLADFARDIIAAGGEAINVDWVPPAAGDVQRAESLSKIEKRTNPSVATANDEAVARLLKADPVLKDVVIAAEVIPTLDRHVVLHAGPPIDWSDMCGPMRGAVCGVCVLEGWANDLQQAEQLANAGELTFTPNHHCNAVGPMTGLTTMSQPVMVVENTAFGNHAYCTINEGLGKVMRFGGNDDEVIERLKWLRQVMGPILGNSLRHADGVHLKPIIARGLAMGDEMHQRNVACTSLILRELAPSMVEANADASAVAQALRFIGGNDQFFLNVAMVMAKAIMDPVADVPGSSIVTAMSRNGTEFGIRVSGTGERWFSAPVEMPEGLYFPGFTAADANPDMGDSTIVETVGLGGFAMAASPAVAGFVGAGSARAASIFTENMYAITHTKNSEWTIPGLDFAGVPTGIDVLKVVETQLAPTINTGIAHREPGVGQVGAGIVRAPMDCFMAALDALAETGE